MSAPMVRTATPGIYKRGSRYVVTFRDPLGRQRKRSARTLAEARELKATLIADVRRGEWRALSKMTFTEYALDWIESYGGRSERGIREETRDDYRKRLGLRFAEDDEGKRTEELEPTGDGAVAYFGRTQLTAIEARDIKAYAKHVSARGVAANTVRLYLAPVKAMLADAFEEGVIRSNPAAGVRLALGRSESREEEHVKALTEEELERLLEAIPDAWRLFFEFLAHTGLRIGEAIALRWQDVDLSRRYVHVRRRWYRGRFDAPKSKYGRRDVPLSRRLAAELEHRWLLEENVEGLVFPSSTGTVLDASNLMRRVLKPAARTAGVPWAGFHTFRHTCATRLFRRRVNAVQVQMWLGHHSPAFTQAVYVHLLSSDLPDGDVFEGNLGATAPPDTGRHAEEAEEAETRIAAGAAYPSVPARPEA